MITTKRKSCSLIGPACLAFCTAFLFSCANRESLAAEASTGAMPKGNTTVWHVFVPNSSNVLMLESAEGNDIAFRAVVADLGEEALPSGLSVPNKYDAVALNEAKNEATCTAPGGMRWTYKLDAAAITAPDIVIGIIGLSYLDDGDGWSVTTAAAFGSGSAWELLSRSRVRNPGPAPTHEACGSGGPGSTSCSQSWNGSSCSVSCGSGHHACCYQASSGSPHCRCVKD